MAKTARSIEFSELGVNDYATHLRQYMAHGEGAMAFIEEDFITDSAERMVSSKYVNLVNFRPSGDDFLSEKGNFSMRAIARNTHDRLTDNNASWELRQRATIEAREIDKLASWFATAETDEVFNVDSLPLAEDEVYAVKRRYHKTRDGNLAMYVIILHSPSVEVFNEYHHRIGADIPPSINALGILENSYTLKIPAGTDIDEFIQADVDEYDSTLTAHYPGQKFVFGMPWDGVSEIANSNDLIRQQKPLLNIYKDAVRALGGCGWAVNSDVMSLNYRLGLGLNLVEGQSLNLDDSRKLLDGVHQFIMSTLNNATRGELQILSQLDEHNYSVAYDAAGYYGGEARDAGVYYASSACPTVINSRSTDEQAALERAFRLNKSPEKRNWRWKKGHCIVEECPTRSEKVDVGPCSVCRKCQAIYDNGQNPEDVYRTSIILDLLVGLFSSKKTAA